MSTKISQENNFQLLGYDTFEGGPDAWYPLGNFETHEQALTAAKIKLQENEKQQPTSTSGGQEFGGIQDRVFIIHPDGYKERIV